mgnify:CR=1 FL=1
MIGGDKSKIDCASCDEPMTWIEYSAGYMSEGSSEFGLSCESDQCGFEIMPENIGDTLSNSWDSLVH